ncbi:MAG: hypothetical protein ACI9TH_003577 [Kiritimatiellia bacterium]|jgi:hypothetical protein
MQNGSILDNPLLRRKEYMKKWMFTLLLPVAGFIASPAYALDFESNFHADEYKSLQTEIVLDNEGGDGDVEFAGQVGFGIGEGPLDEMGLYIGHQDGNEGDLTYFAFWLEENISSGTPFVPFIGTDIGFGKLQRNGVLQDDKSLFFRLNLGVKYFIQKNMAVKASLKLSWADENIYLTDNRQADDKDYGFGLGLHYYY